MPLSEYSVYYRVWNSSSILVGEGEWSTFSHPSNTKWTPMGGFVFPEPGDYEVWAFTDPFNNPDPETNPPFPSPTTLSLENQVPEPSIGGSNKDVANNYMTFEICAHEPLPDLYLSGLTVETPEFAPCGPIEGDIVTVRVEVENLGERETGGMFEIALFVNGAECTNTPRCGSRPVLSSLNTGRTHSVLIPWNTASSPSSVTLRTVVDPGQPGADAIEEMLEDNNEKKTSVEVVPAGVDLVVQSIEPVYEGRSACAVVGEPIDLKVGVRNLRGDGARWVRVDFEHAGAVSAADLMTPMNAQSSSGVGDAVPGCQTRFFRPTASISFMDEGSFIASAEATMANAPEQTDADVNGDRAETRIDVCPAPEGEYNLWVRSPSSVIFSPDFWQVDPTGFLDVSAVIGNAGPSQAPPNVRVTLCERSPGSETCEKVLFSGVTPTAIPAGASFPVPWVLAGQNYAAQLIDYFDFWDGELGPREILIEIENLREDPSWADNGANRLLQVGSVGQGLCVQVEDPSAGELYSPGIVAKAKVKVQKRDPVTGNCLNEPIQPFGLSYLRAHMTCDGGGIDQELGQIDVLDLLKKGLAEYDARGGWIAFNWEPPCGLPECLSGDGKFNFQVSASALNGGQTGSAAAALILDDYSVTLTATPSAEMTANGLDAVEVKAELERYDGSAVSGAPLTFELDPAGDGEVFMTVVGGIENSSGQTTTDAAGFARANVAASFEPGTAIIKAYAPGLESCRAASSIQIAVAPVSPSCEALVLTVPPAVEQNCSPPANRVWTIDQNTPDKKVVCVDRDLQGYDVEVRNDAEFDLLGVSRVNSVRAWNDSKFVLWGNASEKSVLVGQYVSAYDNAQSVIVEAQVGSTNSNALSSFQSGTVNVLKDSDFKSNRPIQFFGGGNSHVENITGASSPTLQNWDAADAAYSNVGGTFCFKNNGRTSPVNGAGFSLLLADSSTGGRPENPTRAVFDGTTVEWLELAVNGKIAVEGFQQRTVGANYVYGGPDYVEGQTPPANKDRCNNGAGPSFFELCFTGSIVDALDVRLLENAEVYVSDSDVRHVTDVQSDAAKDPLYDCAAPNQCRLLLTGSRVTGSLILQNNAVVSVKDTVFSGGVHFGGSSVNEIEGSRFLSPENHFVFNSVSTVANSRFKALTVGDPYSNQPYPQRHQAEGETLPAVGPDLVMHGGEADRLNVYGYRDFDLNGLKEHSLTSGTLSSIGDSGQTAASVEFNNLRAGEIGVYPVQRSDAATQTQRVTLSNASLGELRPVANLYPTNGGTDDRVSLGVSENAAIDRVFLTRDATLVSDSFGSPYERFSAGSLTLTDDRGLESATATFAGPISSGASTTVQFAAGTAVRRTFPTWFYDENGELSDGPLVELIASPGGQTICGGEAAPDCDDAGGVAGYWEPSGLLDPVDFASAAFIVRATLPGGSCEKTVGAMYSEPVAFVKNGAGGCDAGSAPTTSSAPLTDIYTSLPSFLAPGGTVVFIKTDVLVADLSVEIYNSDQTAVRTLASFQNYEEGTGRIYKTVWDGRDGAGLTVAPGDYTVRAVSPSSGANVETVVTVQR